jgi:hypothetical protein
MCAAESACSNRSMSNVAIGGASIACDGPFIITLLAPVRLHDPIPAPRGRAYASDAKVLPAADQGAVGVDLAGCALALCVATGGAGVAAARGVPLASDALATGVGQTVTIGIVAERDAGVAQGGPDRADAGAEGAGRPLSTGLAGLLPRTTWAIAVPIGVGAACLCITDGAGARGVERVVG